MRFPTLSFAFLVAASLVTSACGDDPMTVDADAATSPDAPVATPDAAPDATVAPPDAAPADAEPADAEPADAEPADAEPADAGPSGLQLPSLGNNGGRVPLSLGSGADDLSLLHKQVDVQASGAPSELEIGPAFLTRSSASSTYVYAFVHVTNHGALRRCFDRLDSEGYLDGKGNQVAHSTGGYVYGTIGAVDNVSTDACLGPGESAYIPDILPAPYDQIASISAHFVAGDTDLHDPDTSIVPRDIAIVSQQLTLNAHNLGPNAGRVSSVGTTWMAFDVENQPVAFGFLDPCHQSGAVDLAVGADLPMCDGVFFRGTSTTVQARISFLQSNASKLAPASPRQRAVAASRARLRDLLIAAKRP